MIQSLCILGRQPALGLAELEALYGSEAVTPLSRQAAGLSLDAAEVVFARLGGSTRLASVIGEVESTAWPQIEKALRSSVIHVAASLPAEGKIKLGISVYGLDITPAKLTAAGLTLKKTLRGTGRSVRLVPNQSAELNTAQVFHNALTGDLGIELLVVVGKSSAFIGRTTAVQDIDSYTLRDRGRPKRDARVGMLPPKLAQIIINLAGGSNKSYESRVMSQDANISMSARAHSASASEKRAGEEQPTLMATILDPFCGTGVVLQEALLMGYEAYGTDLEPRMINYSEANLTWLTTTYHVPPTTYHVEVGDATSHHWKTENGKRKIAVVCETYLGRPFTTAPSRQVLEQTVSDVNLILKKFLANIRGQLAPGTRLCLAVPAWQLAPGKFRHLPLIDSLTDLGYECHRFTHISEKDLVYYREGQIVGRELLVLQSKP